MNDRGGVYVVSFIVRNFYEDLGKRSNANIPGIVKRLCFSVF